MIASSRATIASSRATIASSRATIASSGATIASSGATIASSGAIIASSGAIIASSRAIIASSRATGAFPGATGASSGGTGAFRDLVSDAGGFVIWVRPLGLGGFAGGSFLLPSMKLVKICVFAENLAENVNFHAFFDVFEQFSKKEASAANYDGAIIVHVPATIVHDPATIVFIRGVSVLIHPMAGDGDLVFLPSHPAAWSETMSWIIPG